MIDQQKMVSQIKANSNAGCCSETVGSSLDVDHSGDEDSDEELTSPSISRASLRRSSITLFMAMASSSPLVSLTIGSSWGFFNLCRWASRSSLVTEK